MKIRLAVLLSVFLISVDAHAEDFARVLSVTQGVSYALDGKSEALAVKMDVPIKANISSDATGKAQMIFPDDSTLTIAPNTKITLSEYTDTENEENILLNLVSGTARIITGESNRRNPQAFTVNTPQATIGIRGTLVTIQTSGDLTRVYLTETSGKGVSVRNLHTGKVMELRKPGRIITVGPDFMEERKARKEEAAAFNAALRGKSLMAQKRERDRAERLRNMPATSLASGTLPPAGLGEITQSAAFERDGMLSHATLVADNTPVAPITPVLPAPVEPVIPASPADTTTPAAPVIAPIVPEVPTTPVTPEVPSTPDPVLPEQPVDQMVIDNYDVIAGAKFSAGFPSNAVFDFYIESELVRTNTGTFSLEFPSSYSSFSNNTYTANGDNSNLIILPYYGLFNGNYIQNTTGSIGTAEIKTNGKFKINGLDSHFAEGKFIDPSTIEVQSASVIGTYEGEKAESILKAPIEMSRSN